MSAVLNGRTIFLLDGTGALLSATFLGLVLPRFQQFIGMPVEILHGLAVIALVLASYSLSRFAWADHANPRWLRLLANFNLSYCVLTLGLLVGYRSQLTALGVAYFVAEMVIVSGLVGLERKVAASLAPQESSRGQVGA